MATLIRMNGSREVHPKGGIFFDLEELEKLLGVRPARRTVTPRSSGRLLCGPSNVRGVMVVFVDRDRDSGFGLNATATLMYQHSYNRLIYGDALAGSELEVSCVEVEGKEVGKPAKSA